MKEEQEKFIKNLAEKMLKQNNRSTQFPLFYVHEKRERECAPSEDADRIAWLDEDWSEFSEYTDEDDNVWLLSDDASWTCTDIDETIDADEFQERFGSKYTEVKMKEYDYRVPSIGPFFTEESANLHIQQNNYHYTRPFTYVDSAWRNYEMQNVMRLIFEMAGIDVPSQYK